MSSAVGHRLFERQKVDSDGVLEHRFVRFVYLLGAFLIAGRAVFAEGKRWSRTKSPSRPSTLLAPKSLLGWWVIWQPLQFSCAVSG